jgi:hypothetical protein
MFFSEIYQFITDTFHIREVHTSRDGSVIIEMGHGLNDRGMIAGRGKRFLHNIKSESGTHPGDFPGVKAVEA